MISHSSSNCFLSFNKSKARIFASKYTCLINLIYNVSIFDYILVNNYLLHTLLHTFDVKIQHFTITYDTFNILTFSATPLKIAVSRHFSHLYGKYNQEINKLFLVLFHFFSPSSLAQKHALYIQLYYHRLGGFSILFFTLFLLASHASMYLRLISIPFPLYIVYGIISPHKSI